MSVAFVLGNYHLPFTTFAVNTRDVDHTHHDPDGWTWKEKMRLRLCIPAIKPFTVIVSNDNEASNEDQSHSPA